MTHWTLGWKKKCRFAQIHSFHASIRTRRSTGEKWMDAHGPCYAPQKNVVGRYDIVFFTFYHLPPIHPSVAINVVYKSYTLFIVRHDAVQ